MEKRTSSSDNNSLSYESNNFEVPAATTCDQEEVQRWSPDQPLRRGRAGSGGSRGRNKSTDPTPRSKEGQAAGITEAEVVNNNIERRGKEEREQQQIPLPGGPSRRRQLQDIKIRVPDPDDCRKTDFLFRSEL
ncbi:hypothetical protein TNCV_3188801 [Trichonephila clavipes]|nr:hypothetical protein TNCV_3188801 [Trichonephila clavipes]